VLSLQIGVPVAITFMYVIDGGEFSLLSEVVGITIAYHLRGG
jgi:hypothetical protein